jgi:hypothetical protein
MGERERWSVGKDGTCRLGNITDEGLEEKEQGSESENM